MNLCARAKLVVSRVPGCTQLHPVRNVLKVITMY
jgi:hypothetical protein